MFSNLFSTDFANALVWTIVHSLWQFTLIAVLLALVLKFARKTSSAHKYLIAFSALAISTIVSSITFASYYSIPETITTSLENTIQLQASVGLIESSTIMIQTMSFIDTYSSAIIITWLLGSLLFFVRFLGGFIILKKLVKNASPLSDDISNSLKKINKKFAISRKIILKESALISTPMTLGILKPVLLFPIGLINNLSTKEVEAILAHELAHINRHDYFFNLLQSFAEVAFYYHPAIWYISGVIRSERENCCDDIAIATTGHPVSYAKTLVKLQELKGTVLKPALAFSGNSGAFKRRILRILENPQKASFIKDKLVMATLFFACLFTGTDNLQFDNAPEEQNKIDIYVIDDCPKDPEDIKLYLDTIPERNTYSIKKKSLNKEIELDMEDGEITKLKIDGKCIPKSQYDKHADIVEQLIPGEDQDVITVFPECGADFGKIYWLNKKEGKTINLDSILGNANENFNILRDPSFPFLNDAKINRFEELLIDTLQQELHSFVMPKNLEQSIEKGRIDSIFDLFPQDFTRENLFPQDFFQSQESFGNNDLFQSPNDDFFGLIQKEPAFNVTVADVLSRSLLKDAFIDKDKVTNIELTGKYFKIDGEKQPSNIFKKYKNIYERHTGITLDKDSKVILDVDPNRCVKRKLNGISI